MNSYELLIQGFVQGQGVRPAIARLAEEQRWRGSVRNTPRGVLVSLDAVCIPGAELESLIRSSHPALETAVVTCRASSRSGAEGFEISVSDNGDELVAPVPRDIAVCSDCLQESGDPANRRFRFPLISCTRCGPRFSITEDMPFDRSRTSLAHFGMCADCEAEYRSSGNRRSHAQTIGCRNCGPTFWAADRNGRIIDSQDNACQTAAEALGRGEIIALRGIGGYQLLVDAENEQAVEELRRRKGRATKPLAVIVRTLADAERLGCFDAAAREALISPANPIVIVPLNATSTLAAGIQPGLSDIGLMLPTTAVHDRLLELFGRPLVCTSGNREGTPLAVNPGDAKRSLAGIATLWLHHDRPIPHAVDDSVVRPIAGRAATIRSARGMAPLPLGLPHSQNVIALGSYQKTAIAWSNGLQAALGPHIGDLDDLETRERWSSQAISMQRLYGVRKPIWAHDAHPDDVGLQAIPHGANSIAIWHHHAHIVSGMLEYGWLNREVLGIAADGQGYGSDGTLWGGEILRVTAARFRRIGCIRPYALPGGELAPRDPKRIAVALLSQVSDLTHTQIGELTHCDPARIRDIHRAISSRLAPTTTSLGRLFDGVAALLLETDSCSYVGEPAARLEALCDRSATGEYRWHFDTTTDPWQIDWRPMLLELIQDLRNDVSASVIAERFHRAIAGWIASVPKHLHALPVVLGGGVFQNRRLCELILERWPAGTLLGLPGTIPTNDGGLAAGQLAIASAISITRTGTADRWL